MVTRHTKANRHDFLGQIHFRLVKFPYHSFGTHQKLFPLFTIFFPCFFFNTKEIKRKVFDEFKMKDHKIRANRINFAHEIHASLLYIKIRDTFACKHNRTWRTLVFLDASSHLYKRVCPSVRMSVRMSVSILEKPTGRILLPASA